MNPSGLPDTCGIETFFFQQRMVWNTDLSKWTKINVGISVLFKTQTELKDLMWYTKKIIRTLRSINCIGQVEYRISLIFAYDVSYKLTYYKL